MVRRRLTDDEETERVLKRAKETLEGPDCPPVNGPCRPVEFYDARRCDRVLLRGDAAQFFRANWVTVIRHYPGRPVKRRGGAPKLTVHAPGSHLSLTIGEKDVRRICRPAR